MSKNATCASKADGITTHIEAPEQGGKRYYRCEHCGSETIYGPDRILHHDGCPLEGR